MRKKETLEKVLAHLTELLGGEGFDKSDPRSNSPGWWVLNQANLNVEYPIELTTPTTSPSVKRRLLTASGRVYVRIDERFNRRTQVGSTKQILLLSVFVGMKGWVKHVGSLMYFYGSEGGVRFSTAGGDKRTIPFSAGNIDRVNRGHVILQKLLTSPKELD